MGTTSFMLVMHVLATVALLPILELAGFAGLWGAVLGDRAGVTLGLHLPSPTGAGGSGWVERVLVIMGTLACQSGPIEWVGCTATTTASPTNQLITTTPACPWWSHSEWMLHDIQAEGTRSLRR